MIKKKIEEKNKEDLLGFFYCVQISVIANEINGLKKAKLLNEKFTRMIVVKMKKEP